MDARLSDLERVFAGAFSKVRWSERWQEFRDYTPADRPGPMRWLISGTWELRVTIVRELPIGTVVQIGHHTLPVATLPWLQATAPDIADLVSRPWAAGRATGLPGEQ